MKSITEFELGASKFQGSGTDVYPETQQAIVQRNTVDTKIVDLYPYQNKSFDITRFFDIIIAAFFLILLSPLLLIVALLIKITSKGPVLFSQQRVGRNNNDFTFYKLRTMYINSDENNFLTIGMHDIRITPLGVFLRRFKFDELPQLYNVLINDMSIVGPRPEVRKYVNLYTATQKQILKLKPGITDHASIAFINESELLATQPDPEAYYIKKIMPLKIELNRKYAANKTLKNYFGILASTVLSVLR